MLPIIEQLKTQLDLIKKEKVDLTRNKIQEETNSPEETRQIMLLSMYTTAMGDLKKCIDQLQILNEYLY